MKLRQDYPYDLAIKDFLEFINRIVQDEKVLNDFKEILEDAETRKTFPMRCLHEMLMSYIDSNSEDITFNELDREMIEDLIHFWA